MKLSQLIELLREYEAGDRLGFAARPDNTGNRSKGANRQPDRRLMNFPYDRDVSYGQPAPYDRGSSGGATLNHPLTPHDDLNFSLRILGIEDPAEIEEIMGSPTLLSRGGSSQAGSSIPGVGSGWATNPPKDWERSEMDMDEGPLTIDPRPPDIEMVPNADAPDFRMQTDDDLENRFNRIYGGDDNMNFVDPALFGQPDSHVIAPDPWSVVNTRLSSRGLYGMMPKESAWDRISGMTFGKREIS